jgi:hypothetical protein
MSRSVRLDGCSGLGNRARSWSRRTLWLVAVVGVLASNSVELKCSAVWWASREELWANRSGSEE